MSSLVEGRHGSENLGSHDFPSYLQTSQKISFFDLSLWYLSRISFTTIRPTPKRFKHRVYFVPRSMPATKVPHTYQPSCHYTKTIWEQRMLCKVGMPISVYRLSYTDRRPCCRLVWYAQPKGLPFPIKGALGATWDLYIVPCHRHRHQITRCILRNAVYVLLACPLFVELKVVYQFSRDLKCREAGPEAKFTI